MDNNVTQLVEKYPGVAITIQAGELHKFAEFLIEQTIKGWREEVEAKVAESQQEKLLTAKEVASLFGVCTRTVARWCEAGILTPIPVGGLLKYKRSDCLKIIEDGRREA